MTVCCITREVANNANILYKTLYFFDILIVLADHLKNEQESQNDLNYSVLLKYTFQSLLICLLIHIIVILGIFLFNEKDLLFTFSSTKPNENVKSPFFLSMLQKYYFNFENNRFFLKFTILYGIVFFAVKFLNERKMSSQKIDAIKKEKK